MRRITVFEIDSVWTFAPGADSHATWPSLLDASNAAVVFGNSLHGKAAGFVVKLQVPGGERTSSEPVTMFTHVFA